MHTNITRSLLMITFIAFNISNVPLSVARTANDADLTAMKEKYARVEMLTAEFNQAVKSATLGRTKESSGRIYIKRPNMFRWETTQPDPSILVSNGVRFWYYTAPFREGEKGQVTIRPAKQVPSQLAVDLLSGRADLDKTFTAIKRAEGQYTLTPKLNSGDIQRIELFLENQTKLVYKLVLSTKSGNETTIVLKAVELAPKLSKSMFSFVIPPGTEVIH